MKNMKRFILMILVFIMVLSMVPPQAFAAAEVYNSTAAAGAALRKGMVAHEKKITLTCQFSDDVFDGTDARAAELAETIISTALTHTGKGNEGDYLQRQTKSLDFDWEIKKNATITYTFILEYYTTLAQEEKVAKAVSDALSKLKLSKLNDYEKICKIYKYVTDTVAYDYEHLDDYKYTLKYSAYAAIVEKTAVSQGVASLLYRMLLEAGVDCRQVYGKVDATKNDWNIVEFNDEYYYLDATLDLGKNPFDYEYFLRGFYQFDDHEPDAACVNGPLGFLDNYLFAPHEYIGTGFGTKKSGDFVYCGTNGFAVIANYTGTDATVTIPDSLGGYPVRMIMDGAFYQNQSLKKVVIADSVQFIGNSHYVIPTRNHDVNRPYVNNLGAFEQCTNLKEVVFSSDSELMHVGQLAFARCTALKSINLPSTTYALNWDCFNGCTALKKLTLPEGLNRVLDSALTDTSLTTLHLPSTCVFFGASNFMPKLESVTVADANSELRSHEGVLYGKDWFERFYLQLYPLSKKSESYTVADFAEYINVDALPRSIDYAGFGIPEYLQKLYIRDLEFWDNTRAGLLACEIIPDTTNPYLINQDGFLLSADGKTLYQVPDHISGTLVLPSGIREIAYRACSYGNYSHVQIPDSVRKFGYSIFEHCLNLESVDLPARLSVIPQQMFLDCSNLKSFVIPDGVDEIGDGAFIGCQNLEYVVIPESVTYINAQAFASCLALEEVYYLGTKEQWKEIFIHERNNEFLLSAKRYYGESSLKEKLTLKIVTQPKTAYAKMGETAKVTVKANGIGLKYQWYFKNANGSKYSKSSVTGPVYSCKMSEKSKDRRVLCIITDEDGKEVQTKTVMIREAASIVTEPKNTYVKNGKTAKVTLEASGDGLTYTWYIKNAGKTKYTKSSVTSATYSCKMNEKSRDRYVYCVVTDQYGKTVKSKTVVLRMAASIITQPKDVTVKEGKSAKVTVEAVGDGLTYQWYIKNEGSSKFSKSSITKATYSAKMSDKVDGRQVYCVVTDKYGKTVKSSTVTLRMK